MHDAHVVVWFDRMMNIECCINLGKDACGIKPRWLDFSSMTDLEIDQEINHFANSINEDRIDREEYAKFEDELEADRKAANAYIPNAAMALAFGSLNPLIAE